MSADEKFIDKPVNGGGPNALCANAADMSPGGFENSRMVGLKLSYGKFTYLNLIDLDWHSELQLACPVNKLGKVTLYQTSRHGSDAAGAPAFLGAILPQVVVVNNGPKKVLGQGDKRIQPIVDMARRRPSETSPYYDSPRCRDRGIWQDTCRWSKDPAHNLPKT